MNKIYENDIEQMVIELLEKEGYSFLHPEDADAEREDLTKVALLGRLQAQVAKLNPDVPESAQNDAVKKVISAQGSDLIGRNEAFHNLFVSGVDVEYLKDGVMRGEKVWLVDFDNIENNDLVVTNQMNIYGETKNAHKIPDVVLYINGLPLAVIELKNPTDEQATIGKAYTQLQNYKNAIPQLFNYNGILVASDGLEARVGSLTAGIDRFMVWKQADGSDNTTTPQIETLVKEMLTPKVFLDLIRHFTVFEQSKSEDQKTGQVRIDTVKKVAAYHQYYAVNKAITSTLEAAREGGSHKAGVIWHTQGSGKSLSMVFYAGKVVLALNNPTILVITDRNDLDEQLYGTFAQSKNLLRQEPTQAQNRAHLKELLKTSGGGIVFSTIQKFYPEDGGEKYDLLSDRNNIIVIADEAHRSQYGFAARTILKDAEAITRYGNAKYLRDALPNASFIGFTGTPIEQEDKSTPAVFGEYVDVYDVERAVEDNATVPIYYESRLAKVQLNEEEHSKVDDEVEAITEDIDLTDKEKAKAKWAQLEAIIGQDGRLDEIAGDLVEHFDARQEAFEGKGMFVAMSRRIAVEMYERIVVLRPDWHSEDLDKGSVKVIMTASSSDPESWQPHHTSKEDRKKLANRFKDPDDPLKMVIVRDMWLTGFDVPSLHTMYIDKLMRGHNLMQAIARVNRVYKDKVGGLIVDYIGFAADLQKAFATYTQSGGKGRPTFDQGEAISLMIEKHEIVSQMFDGFEYKRYFNADTKTKLQIILEASEHILALEKGKERFVRECTMLSKVYALATPSLQAEQLRDDIGFFQAIKSRLMKFDTTGTGTGKVDVETAIKQIVDNALVSEGVIDIFAAAGLEKPNVSAFSDEFFDEVRNMKQKNLAVELLKKLLNDELKVQMKRNLIKGKKLSEMLSKSIKKYQNQILTAAQVISELIDIAKEVRSDNERGDKLGLSEDELAFYDALADNESAKDILGDEQLRDIAHILVEKVRSSATVDWTRRENVKAKMRVLVKRTLREYGYPPDKQKLATDNILKQAEMFATDWSES